MPRKLYEAATDGKDTLGIIALASSGGGEYYHPGRLCLVRIDNDDLSGLDLNKCMVRNNPNIEVLEDQWIDRRFDGPNSHAGKAVEELSKKIDRLLPGARREKNLTPGALNEWAKGADPMRAWV